MLKEVDEDGSGAIEFEEFCQIMKKKMVRKK
jgi:Ca2+-binding EF-hand superfamily protein